MIWEAATLAIFATGGTVPIVAWQVNVPINSGLYNLTDVLGMTQLVLNGGSFIQAWTTVSGVLGERMLGGGDKGAAGALVRADAVEELLDELSGKPARRASGPCSFHASENVSVAPGADSQLRPARPRPAVWCAASSRVGPARVSSRASRSALVEPVCATTSMATCAAPGAQRRLISAADSVMALPCAPCTVRAGRR